MSSSEQLSAAIDALYETFGSYRTGKHVAGCPCCVTPEEEGRLVQKRLRDLTADDLDGFAFSALNTWGTLTDFKHFLPRILELASESELRTDLQTVYGKFLRDQEGPWLPSEHRTLERFTLAFFVDVVGRDRATRARPIDILESAGLAGMDVAALLEAGFREVSPGRASLVASLVRNEANALAQGQPRWVWWKDDRDRVLHTWLLSGRAYQLLERAFEAHPDDRESGDWAAACDVLEALGGLG